MGKNRKSCIKMLAPITNCYTLCSKFILAAVKAYEALVRATMSSQMINCVNYKNKIIHNNNKKKLAKSTDLNSLITNVVQKYNLSFPLERRQMDSDT